MKRRLARLRPLHLKLAVFPRPYVKGSSRLRKTVACAMGSRPRGYRPRQASFLAEDRSLNSRNARQIESSDWLSVESYLKVQWGPEQIAAEVPISHETIYRHIYADKALDGVLYRQLGCKKSDVSGMPAAGIEEAK